MFYIFHGDDSHSQRETLERLKAQLGDQQMVDLNTTRLDGRGLTFTELRQACDTIPFLAPARLIIVEELFGSRPAEPLVVALLDYLPQLPDTSRLVFLESQALPPSNPVLKLAEEAENGYAKVFARPEGRALEGWIRQRVQQLNGRITPTAVRLLVDNVGSDLRILNNELEKLVLYAGPERMVDTAEVERLSPYVAEASIFDLVDALGGRNGRQTALLLQRKINEGADPFYLFAMFIRQFRLLIQVKVLAEQGLPTPAIAKKLKLHGFVAGKLHQQSQRFTLDQLTQIYSHLLDIDVGVKTGRNELNTALDLLAAGLTS